MNERRQLCTFFIGEALLGIDVLRVQEVLRSQPVTPVPLAPPGIVGLINLRSQIVPVLQLATRLGLPESDAPHAHQMNVVVLTEAGLVSLLVHRIGEVVFVDRDKRTAPPHSIPPEIRALLMEIYRLEGRLLLTLDVDRTVQVCAPTSARRVA